MNRFEHGQALVVSVAGYPRLPPACRLPASVVNDALQVHRLLGDPERCCYLAHRLKLLSEEQATVSAIREGLRWLAATDVKDTAIFYFSGHGLLEQTDTGERLSLAACDAGEDGAGRLDAEELAGLFNDIPAGRLLVVLDCCHAAGLGDLRASLEAAPAPPAVLVESVYDLLREGEGKAILAAARRAEAAEAPPDLDTSLLTHHFLVALEGRGARRTSGVVTLFDVFEHISGEMAGSHQKPILKSILGNNFPIALLCAGHREPFRPDGTYEEQREICLDFLESLPERPFHEVVERLDPKGASHALAPNLDEILNRRRQAESLVQLMGQRGRPAWSRLCEAALEAISPFSPVDRDWAEWERKPARCWANDGEEFVGLGEDPPLKPSGAPAGLESGSLLSWRGLPFRDAAVAAGLFLPTLERGGGAGFWLRRAGEGGVLGLLRSSRGHGIVLEIWRRDGFGMKCLAAAALPTSTDGWYQTRFELRGQRARLCGNEVEIQARLSAELPAGRLALARFDDALIRIRGLELNVRTR